MDVALIRISVFSGIFSSFSHAWPVASAFVQLFTLYRATDIDDLITNVAGTLIGYWGFRLIYKLVKTKGHFKCDFEEPYGMWYMPVAMIVTTFVLGFFN